MLFKQKHVVKDRLLYITGSSWLYVGSLRYLKTYLKKQNMHTLSSRLENSLSLINSTILLRLAQIQLLLMMSYLKETKNYENVANVINSTAIFGVQKKIKLQILKGKSTISETITCCTLHTFWNKKSQHYLFKSKKYNMKTHRIQLGLRHAEEIKNSELL